jgi:cytochrome c oxidase accessory protein FixG
MDDAHPQRANTGKTEENILSRSEQKQAPLYAGTVKVYPQQIVGPLRRIKWTALCAMLGAYYLVPWLRYDRGPNAPDQAVLIDLPSRRAYFFSIEIWPQEVYYLTGLLILGALGLFLATSIGGRVWCGYACPQTVWTDLFLWVEHKFQGDRNARMRLDRMPWAADKLLRIGATHVVWLAIAFATGGAWVMYFVDAPSLFSSFLWGEASSVEYFFVGLFTATTYLLAGHAREQVCTYMCPWPRFQAALLDEDSLVVTYRRWRGEPRGKHKKGDSWTGRGDCVDCKQCISVCPTGIDIRDGLQLECIGCGLCIDACDSVMEKVGRPRRLIAFDTARNVRAREQGTIAAVRIVRPRTLVYVALILLVAAGMLTTLANRASMELTVLHERSPLFVELSDGTIRNDYTVKILNKRREPRSFHLTLEAAPADSKLTLLGQTAAQEGRLTLSTEPDSVQTYRVQIRAPKQIIVGQSKPAVFLLEGSDGEIARYASVFRGPER